MSNRIAAVIGFTLFALPTAALAQDMGAYWPNDDGRAWTYQDRVEQFFPVPGVSDQVARLVFDGTTVAPNGIAAQVLREQLLSGSISTSATDAPGVTSPLMRNLWRARPDLRDAIARLASVSTAGSPCPTDGGGTSLLLGGGLTYRKTSDEIAAWRCNRADTRAWLWLVSNLAPGNTFTLQLVPDLASDVYLHGTMAAIEDVTVPAGTFNQCLRVDYVIDYGTSECTDEIGNPHGTSRSETRGFVHYAPGVGPVQSSEDFIPFAEATGDCTDPGNVGRVAGRVTRKLASDVVPVVRTSWGRIKLIYR
jgi:hypothetical protein